MFRVKRGDGAKKGDEKCCQRIEMQGVGRVARPVIHIDSPSFERSLNANHLCLFTHLPVGRDPLRIPYHPITLARARANLLLSPSAVLNMDFVDRFEKRTLWGAGKNLSAKWGSTTVIMRGRPAGM